MHDPLPLTGTRVVLRRLRSGDLARFQAYRHDADVGRYQGWEPQPDEEARAFIAEMSRAEFGCLGEWLQIAIADAATDELLGDIGLVVMQSGREAEFGITLAGDAQGKGLAEEASRTLAEGLRTHTEVRRLIGITDTRNTASARLLERLGMTLEAEVAADFRGQPCHERHYAMAL